jgi:2,5-dihydroxypyridine 5,6-dioxygenase
MCERTRMPYARTRTGPFAPIDLIPLFRHQLEGCRLQPGERCLVLTDSAHDPATSVACLRAALDLGAEALVVTIPADGGDPGAYLASLYRASQLIVVVTPTRVHYDPHLRSALDAGARALMAVQPNHVLERLRADPLVVERTRAGAARLARAQEVRITSAAGTDLTMRVGGRPALAHCGVADGPGQFDFWGGAMVEIAPHEGSAEGTLVLATGDHIFHLGRYIEQPLRLTIAHGRVVAIEGGLDAELLRRYLDDLHEDGARLVGHIAWGTDHRARWTAQLVQFPEVGSGNADAEGYLGSVQVQLGSNNDQYFCGSIDSAAHMGLAMLGASLALDGEPVIEAGVLRGG